MGQIKPHQRRLSIGMAVVFAMQVFAVTFCFSAQASATPTTSRTAMAMPCPVGMDAPAQNEVPCTYCNLPDTNALSGSINSLSTDMPLLAILTDVWRLTPIEPVTHAYRIAQAQAPPGSASVIFKTSLRIRL